MARTSKALSLDRQKSVGIGPIYVVRKPFPIQYRSWILGGHMGNWGWIPSPQLASFEQINLLVPSSHTCRDNVIWSASKFISYIAVVILGQWRSAERPVFVTLRHHRIVGRVFIFKGFIFIYIIVVIR